MILEYAMRCSCREHPRSRTILIALVAAVEVLLFGCGYRFGTTSAESPFPPEFKTIVVESAANNTTVSGIEIELTNDLRQEFAVSRGLSAVRSGGDVVLKTIIGSYVDTPSSFRADGKELTRIGTLNVACSLNRSSDPRKTLWNKDFSASYSYNVTDTISETLTNRRSAISQMIRSLIPRIHQALYDNF
jgi:hypothetical protein